MSARPTVPQQKHGPQRAEDLEASKEQKERQQRLQKAAAVLAALRDSAGISKEDFNIRVSVDKVFVTYRTKSMWVQGLKSIRRSIEGKDPIWAEHDPDELLRWLDREEREDHEQRKQREQREQSDDSMYLKAKREGAFFQAANAIFDWELPLLPAEITVFLCYVRHANGRKGRVEKLSGAQVGRECGGMTGQYTRRVTGFLELATMLEKTFEGGAQGGKRATNRKTNEYLIPWLTRKFTRGSLVDAIERARDKWCYECSGATKHPGAKHPRGTKRAGRAGTKVKKDEKKPGKLSKAATPATPAKPVKPASDDDDW